MVLPCPDPPPYIHMSMPNRSLGVVARRWAVAWIALTSLGIAGGAWAIGAWPVMPFAGIEVLLVVFAFHVLGRHDADFERIEIGPHEVKVEARHARSVVEFVAYRPWAVVEVRERGLRCTLSLAYAG